MELTMKWTEVYKGIYIEVAHWGIGNAYRPAGTWNYYLYIPNDGLPAARRKELLPRRTRSTYGEKRLIWNYMRCGLAGLDWHGGITFYEQRYRDDGSPLMIKAGCDYAHHFDKGIEYSERMVMADAHEAVDSLWRLVPEMIA